MEPPTWQPIELRCGICDKTWDVWQRIGVPVATWAAHLRSHQCPGCGASLRNVFIRPPDEPPP